MRYKSFYILSTLIILSCKKEEKKDPPNYTCSDLITQFSTNHTALHNLNISTQYIANGCENDINEIPGTRSTVYITAAKNACTGVAISDHHILTAAHCLYDTESSKVVSEREIFIKSSNKIEINNINFYFERTGPIERFVHPMYIHNLENKFVPLGDIAIIKTISSLKNLNVIPIKIAKHYKEGEKVLSIGYGRIAEENKDSNVLKRWTLSTLRKAKQNFPFENSDIQRYQAALNSNNVDRSIAPSIRDSFLIMNRENHYEGQTCKGDSGGPQLVNRNGKAALISLTQGVHGILIDQSEIQKDGDTCIKYGSSNNTYVAPYSIWINSILKQSNEKLEYIENF